MKVILLKAAAVKRAARIRLYPSSPTRSKKTVSMLKSSTPFPTMLPSTLSLKK